MSADPTMILKQPEKNNLPEDPKETVSQAADNELELRPAPAKLLIAVFLALAVGITIGAVVVHGSAKSEPTAAANTEKPAEAADPNTVKLEEAQMSSVKLDKAAMQSFHGEHNTTGRIAFNDDKVTPVFSPYTGRIVLMHANPGEVVEKGAPLFEIDTPDLVQVESDLISAVSNLKNAQAALTLAQRNKTIAERTITSGERKLELAVINQKRQKELYDAQAVALKDWEQAERDAQQAHQDLDQAHKDLEQSESDIKNAENNIDANKTILDAARDRLRVYGKTAEEVAKIEKEHLIDRITRVFAPISGTVTQRKVGVGQYVKPDNPDPLFVIADLSTMWMLADVCESDVGMLKLGLAAEVSVMGYPGETFKGTIGYISPCCDPNSHRIAVRCVIDNVNQKLKSDMFATFKILTNAEAQFAAVPVKSIVREGEKKFVWVQQNDQKFQKRQVSTGIEQAGFVQILSGVSSGEKIVCEGGLFLSNAANP